MLNKRILILVVPLVILLSVVGYISYALYGQKYTGPDVDFSVGPGERFASINARLTEQGLIKSPTLFYQYCKYQQYLNKLKTGTFRLQGPISTVQVIDTLVNGEPLAAMVTIPEGKNLYEIGKILADLGLVDYVEFKRVATDTKFARSLNIRGSTVEGYLFPDTYKITTGTTPKAIIRMMVRQFFKKVGVLDLKDAGMSLTDIVTLASIVEKETGARSERPIIAGVFKNRLKQKMRLQSDPTTIYGIYETFDGNLKKEHLLAVTPYNTYKIPALPKGPIANPGLEAIKAVIHPEKHPFLFFVSKNDGTHIFTKTYQEHTKAVENFQINASAREGKSWRQMDASKR